MKVRVQEYRDRIFELPDNHFEDENGRIDCALVKIILSPTMKFFYILTKN